VPGQNGRADAGRERNATLRFRPTTAPADEVVSPRTVTRWENGRR